MFLSTSPLPARTANHAPELKVYKIYRRPFIALQGTGVASFLGQPGEVIGMQIRAGARASGRSIIGVRKRDGERAGRQFVSGRTSFIDFAKFAHTFHLPEVSCRESRLREVSRRKLSHRPEVDRAAARAGRQGQQLESIKRAVCIAKSLIIIITRLPVDRAAPTTQSGPSFFI